MKNVLSRKEKSIGINKQVIKMINDWCFGPIHFEVALIFGESMLLSSILTNCESWYKVKQEEINSRFEFIKRRLIFLHYIPNETGDSLINRVFKAQEKNISKND